MEVMRVVATVPHIRDLGVDLESFPVGYKPPRVAVERAAVRAVKARLKMRATASLPETVNADVDMGAAGVVRIRGGAVEKTLP